MNIELMLSSCKLNSRNLICINAQRSCSKNCFTVFKDFYFPTLFRTSTHFSERFLLLWVLHSEDNFRRGFTIFEDDDNVIWILPVGTSNLLYPPGIIYCCRNFPVTLIRSLGIKLSLLSYSPPIKVFPVRPKRQLGCIDQSDPISSCDK